MNKAKQITRSFSSVFSLISLGNEYSKALQENPGADRKETLRQIKKQVMQKQVAKTKIKSNTEEFLTNNDITMSRIIQQTKELISTIDDEVKSRIKFYETHESRWQDSDKGRSYTEETENLSELLNTLNDAICGMEKK